MKVLVFEYVTGGGWGDVPLPAALLQEAESMQVALLRDLQELPGVTVAALRDARWPVPAELASTIEWTVIEPEESIRAIWLDALKTCDAAWPIAPESAGILEVLCRDVESAHKILLNCPSAAVRLATSKRATINRLAQQNVPVVPTVGFKGYRPVFPLVIKPDDGVGCQGIRIVRTEEEWDAALCEINPSLFVVQPLLEGNSQSLSVLVAQGKSSLLSCNRQIVASQANRLQLEAIEVNAIPLTPKHHALAAAVAQAIPELWGYVGIDFLDMNGELRVLEINPRLTTAIAGLRDALGLNLASAVIRLTEGESWDDNKRTTPGQPVTISWQSEP